MPATDRETVTETIVEATVRVDVPIDRGDELAAGAQEILESVAAVRYADVREIEDVDAGDDGLSVATDCRLTLHVAGPDREATADAATVRDALEAADRVLGTDRFEIVDGPYRIEAW